MGRILEGLEEVKKNADSKSLCPLEVVNFNPDFAVDVVARRRKPQRNEQLERFVAFSFPELNLIIYHT